LTRAAVHLIENGRSRPSWASLELIARRTGKPIEFFTSAAPAQPAEPSPVRDIERLVLTEQFDEAVEAASGLLDGGQTPSVRAETLYWKGRSLVRLVRGPDAEQALGESLRMYAKLGDRWAAVEAKHYLSKALFLQQRDEALDMAREALAECRELDPKPIATEAGLLEGIAAMHLARYEWQEAIDTYDLAIEAAGSLRDLGRVGQMYDNLSLAYTELGQYERAQEYASKALALTRVERDKRGLARIENNLGVLLTKRGLLDAAEKHLLEALRLAEETNSDGFRAPVFISLGELYVARGDRAVADGFLQQAEQLAARLGERLSQATAHEVLAQSALLEDDYDHAEREYQAAISLLSTADAPARLASCRISYARMLRRRGDTQAALDQWEAALADPKRAASEPLTFLMVG
jgi:tetratricopeptide (TPR) repeat protein